MKIEDYEKARCELLRDPPLSIDTLEEHLQIALVKAWERGISAHQAVNSVVNDDKLIDQLAGQVAENIEYQKATELQALAKEKEEQFTRYRKEEEEKLQQAETTWGYEQKTREEELRRAQQESEERKGTYSAAQARLEEMKARMRARLEKVGGVEGYQTLVKMQEEMNPSASTSAKSSGQGAHEGIDSLSYQSQKSIAPDYTGENPKSEQPKHGGLEEKLVSEEYELGQSEQKQPAAIAKYEKNWLYRVAQKIYHFFRSPKGDDD